MGFLNFVAHMAHLPKAISYANSSDPAKRQAYALRGKVNQALYDVGSTTKPGEDGSGRLINEIGRILMEHRPSTRVLCELANLDPDAAQMVEVTCMVLAGEDS